MYLVSRRLLSLCLTKAVERHISHGLSTRYVISHVTSQCDIPCDISMWYPMWHLNVISHVTSQCIMSRAGTWAEQSIDSDDCHNHSWVCCNWARQTSCRYRCSVLQCVAVCCSVMQCDAVWCNVLQCVAQCCRMLQCEHCIVVCCSVLLLLTSTDATFGVTCNTLQHTATHCNTLQHTATHCNTLQHALRLENIPCLGDLWSTATHCNTLQHAATRRNTHLDLIRPSLGPWVSVYSKRSVWIARMSPMNIGKISMYIYVYICIYMYTYVYTQGFAILIRDFVYE